MTDVLYKNLVFSIFFCVSIRIPLRFSPNSMFCVCSSVPVTMRKGLLLGGFIGRYQSLWLAALHLVEIRCIDHQRNAIPRLYMYVFKHIKVWTSSLKLKTIHKCFLYPYKRQSSIQILTSNGSRDAGKACHREGYITQSNTFACVESPHYFAWLVVGFQIVFKAVLHGFDSYI